MSLPVPFHFALFSARDAPRTRPSKVSSAIQPPAFLLERFLAHLGNASASWNTHTPVCTWEGVICDKTEHVQTVELGAHSLSGSPAWGFLPESLSILNLSHNKLSGTVDFDSFPMQLTKLDLGQNSFTGHVTFLSLPQTLRYLDLSHNEFTGCDALTTIRVGLREMYINHNLQLIGFVDVPKLPKSLVHRSWQHTQIEAKWI